MCRKSEDQDSSLDDVIQMNIFISTVSKMYTIHDKRKVTFLLIHCDMHCLTEHLLWFMEKEAP